MRVLHVGNVANNGYNNAKLLRRIGVEADAVCDETHTISQPEWEEAPEWTPSPDGGAPTDPRGWSRPPWVLPLRVPPRRPKGWYRATYLSRLAAALPRLRRLHAELAPEAAELRGVIAGELSFGDVVAGFRSSWMHELVMGPQRPLFGAYDVVQAYATHAVLPLLSGTRPFVAFEHGTMRDLPFEDTARGRLLALAYRRAARVVITNPDVIVAAGRLGLENHVFVPHPVDEERYTPGESALGRELREQGDPVLFSPSRHDWELKGTDRLLDAFAELVRHDEPRALLVLTTWGAEVQRSRALARELGVAERVRWFPPFPKQRLLDAYRAADVVLDQFAIGTFGGISPEAMCCARPVLVAYDPEVHEWCFPEPPPVVRARTTPEIYDALRCLARDPDERERIGLAGRAWVERHHGWRLVAERQLRIYEELLDPGYAATGSSADAGLRGVPSGEIPSSES